MHFCCCLSASLGDAPPLYLQCNSGTTHMVSGLKVTVPHFYRSLIISQPSITKEVIEGLRSTNHILVYISVCMSH